MKLGRRLGSVTNFTAFTNFVILCSPNAGDEDSYEFIGFLQEKLNLGWIICQWNFLDQTKSPFGFPKFFEANFHLVYEIAWRLRRLGFAVIE